MLDWIHHKFLKFNFLREIRSYVAKELQKWDASSGKLGKVFLELHT